MDVLNPVPEAVAGRPIHAGPREAAVPGRLSFLSERGDGRTWKDNLIVASSEREYERLSLEMSARWPELTDAIDG